MESGESDLTFYVLLRAVERFHSDFGRYPGVLDGQLEADNMHLKVSFQASFPFFSCN
jgi:amyloid beta precursor protein binding protein 1